MATNDDEIGGGKAAGTSRLGNTMGSGDNRLMIVMARLSDLREGWLFVIRLFYEPRVLMQSESRSKVERFHPELIWYMLPLLSTYLP